MPGVSVQFHMLLDEVVDFVAEMMIRFSLSVELEGYFSKTRRVVAPDANLRDEVKLFGVVNRMWLLYRPPRCRTFERFHLALGEVRKKRMSQAHLGAGTDKPAAFKVLTQIARELKKRTAAGVWVTTEAGNCGFAKEFRYSPGAADAVRRGKLKLQSVAFTQDFRVDPPQRPLVAEPRCDSDRRRLP